MNLAEPALIVIVVVGGVLNMVIVQGEAPEASGRVESVDEDCSRIQV